MQGLLTSEDQIFLGVKAAINMNLHKVNLAREARIIRATQLGHDQFSITEMDTGAQILSPYDHTTKEPCVPKTSPSSTSCGLGVFMDDATEAATPSDLELI